MRQDEVQPGQKTTSGRTEAHRHDLADLYELLEISPRASQEVIQAAYRALARFYHPDVNASADAEARIRQLNAAYTVLSDPQGRARYDLECLRAHRFERLLHSEATDALVRSAAVSRSRALPVRQRPVRQGAAEGRLTFTNGAAIFGLLVVAAMAAVFLVAIAMSTEAPAGYSSVFDEPGMPFVQR